MTNPMNCETCDHKKNAPVGTHCYMFQEEPTALCQQHTAFKMLGHEIADDVQAAIARPSFYKLFKDAQR